MPQWKPQTNIDLLDVTPHRLQSFVLSKTPPTAQLQMAGEWKKKNKWEDSSFYQPTHRTHHRRRRMCSFLFFQRVVRAHICKEFQSVNVCFFFKKLCSVDSHSGNCSSWKHPELCRRDPTAFSLLPWQVTLTSVRFGRDLWLWWIWHTSPIILILPLSPGDPLLPLIAIFPRETYYQGTSGDSEITTSCLRFDDTSAPDTSEFCFVFTDIR